MADPTPPDQPTPLALAAAVLRCPQHGRDAGAAAAPDQALRLEAGGLVCAAGHRFDLAAQGYVNLLGRAAPAAADTADMVAARVEVQAAGFHRALTDTLVDVVVGALPGVSRPVIVDLGAGTGHHLAAVLDAIDATVGIAIDLSKYAARRAARAHPRMAAVVADVWGPLPLGDACAEVVLTVFAPRNRIEVARILRPGGHLIVATPDTEHLHPLVERLGLLQVGDDKLDRLDAELDGVATRVDRTVVRSTRPLDHRLVRAVAGMGPSAHHLDAVELDRRIATLPDPVEVTQAVVVSTYRRADASRTGS